MAGYIFAEGTGFSDNMQEIEMHYTRVKDLIDTMSELGIAEDYYWIGDAKDSWFRETDRLLMEIWDKTQKLKECALKIESMGLLFEYTQKKVDSLFE